MKKPATTLYLLACLGITLLSGILPRASLCAEKQRLRMGYFPNITHAQAIIGVAQGTFQKDLGDNVALEVTIFNAGPSVIEAIFTGQLDIAYIGPSPSINGYVKSKGEALKILAGAASGGAGLVVRSDAGIKTTQDFHKKKIASPQLGNTQDVALRAWLQQQGFSLIERGGDVQVMPVQNPDQLSLFLKKEIDAAWTVEPWVTRLIREGKGTLYFDEKSIWPEHEFVTANIIVSTKFLKEHPEVIKKFIAAHVKLTQWIGNNQAESKQIINSEIKRITGKALPPAILDEAFSRITITYDPIKKSLLTYAQWAFEQGFLGKTFPDLSKIYDLSILNEVLTASKMATIPE